MHNLAFRLKRAYLRNLALCRPLAARFALTPARFDILFALSHFERRLPRQRDLLGILGLAASTISEMLGRLEELHFIRRKPDPTDRRHRLISLTEAGYRCIIDATQDILFGGEEWETIENAYTAAMTRRIPIKRDGRLFIPTPAEARLAATEALDDLFEFARRFARGLGDGASLVFPGGDEEVMGQPNVVEFFAVIPGALAAP